LCQERGNRKRKRSRLKKKKKQTVRSEEREGRGAAKPKQWGREPRSTTEVGARVFLSVKLVMEERKERYNNVNLGGKKRGGTWMKTLFG